MLSTSENMFSNKNDGNNFWPEKKKTKKENNKNKSGRKKL